MSRRERVRVAAVLLAVSGIYSFAPLAASYHLLTVPHHFCVEHHALEHDCQDDDCHSDGPLVVGEEEVLTATASLSGEHRHSICQQTTEARRDVSGVEIERGDGNPLDVDDARRPPARRGHHGLCSLTVAPKHSPPVLS